MQLSKKARVLKFGNLPVDKELQNGLASFLNELYKALKLNTVGGDSCVSAEVDADSRTAMVEFRTVKEAAAAKAHLSGVDYGENKLTVEMADGCSELTPEARPLCVRAGPRPCRHVKMKAGCGRIRACLRYEWQALTSARIRANRNRPSAWVMACWVSTAMRRRRGLPLR